VSVVAAVVMLWCCGAVVLCCNDRLNNACAEIRSSGPTNVVTSTCCTIVWVQVFQAVGSATMLGASTASHGQIPRQRTPTYLLLRVAGLCKALQMVARNVQSY
jgi:hypothetical protein